MSVSIGMFQRLLTFQVLTLLWNSSSASVSLSKLYKTESGKITKANEIPVVSIPFIPLSEISENSEAKAGDVNGTSISTDPYHAEIMNDHSQNVSINEANTKSIITTQIETYDFDEINPGDVKRKPTVVDSFRDVSEIPINNDLFEGKMVLLLRANPLTNYTFGGNEKILWELQIQGKFKRTPGPLYLSVEVPKEDKLQVSWGLRAIFNTFSKLIQVLGYDLHKSVGEKDQIPHIASPAFQAFDKFVDTNTTEFHPRLGEEIEESGERCRQRRKLEIDHTINTYSLYTMSFNDTFFDPAAWMVTGIPLLKSVDMSKYANSLRFVVYEVEEEDYQQVRIKNGDTKATIKGDHTKRNIAFGMQMRNLF